MYEKRGEREEEREREGLFGVCTENEGNSFCLCALFISDGVREMEERRGGRREERTCLWIWSWSKLKVGENSFLFDYERKSYFCSHSQYLWWIWGTHSHSHSQEKKGEHLVMTATPNRPFSAPLYVRSFVKPHTSSPWFWNNILLLPF